MTTAIVPRVSGGEEEHGHLEEFRTDPIGLMQRVSDECGDVVREVSFADSALQYCPTCQTGGKPLADRRLSRLLK